MNKMIVLLALAGCGDNLGTFDAGSGRDGAASDAVQGPPRAVVVAGDFGPNDPGVMALVDPQTLIVAQGVAPEGAVGDDPVLREYGGELLIVNRSDGDNVTILDSATRAFVAQLGTGAGSNPQDVAVVGNKLYVPTLMGKGVAVLTRGSNTIATIDLSADDPDGNPNCGSAYLVGTELYVACGLLDDATFAPRGPGKVYLIDTTSDTVTSSLTLTTKNPNGLFELMPSGNLVVPTAGTNLGPPDYNYDGLGCIEQITTGATPAATGCIETNTTLGGFAARLAFAGSTMWIAVSNNPIGNLRSFDLSAMMLAAPISAATLQINDLAVCRDGSIVASDETYGGGGLHVYRAGAEVTTMALNIGITPASAHGLVCD